MIALDSFLLFLAMLTATYFTRLIGLFALRKRTLSKRAPAVMEAAPGCVLIAGIAPYFVSAQPQDVLAIEGGVVTIENEEACIACGDCVEECPMGVITEIVED